MTDVELYVGAGWLALNVLVALLGRRHYRRRLNRLHRDWTGRMAEVLEDQRHDLASARRARAELSGYRSAVRDLTAVGGAQATLAESYREAGRNGQEAPV